MEERIIRMINAKIDDFFKSDLGRDIGKGGDTLGGKVRKYRKEHENHKLSEIKAISLLLEVGLVEEIVIKKYK